MTKHERFAIQVTIHDLRVIMGILDGPLLGGGHAPGPAATFAKAKENVRIVLSNLEVYLPQLDVPMALELELQGFLLEWKRASREKKL